MQMSRFSGLFRAQVSPSVRPWFPVGAVGAFLGAVAILGGLAGCDPSAKSTESAVVSARSERLSREYESCGATPHCIEGLRCFDGVCRASTANPVGDYNAAAGARSLRAGDIDAANEQYAAAVNLYEAGGGEVPTWLRCAQGHALTAARTNPEKAELAARVVHRCFLAAPVGSTLRRQALADFAELGDSGLDPLLVGRPSPADVYLTKQPKRPPVEDLKLSVGGDGKTRAKSYVAALEAFSSAETRTQLVPCWEAYWQASGEKRLEVPVTMKYRWVQGEFEENDRYVLSITGAAPAGGPEAAAYLCVSGALSESVAAFRTGGGAWESTLTFVLE